MAVCLKGTLERSERYPIYSAFLCCVNMSGFLAFCQDSYKLLPRPLYEWGVGPYHLSEPGNENLMASAGASSNPGDAEIGDGLKTNAIIKFYWRIQLFLCKDSSWNHSKIACDE